MGIRFTKTNAQYVKLMNDIEKILNNELRNTFAYLGEQCVKRIRNRSAKESWIDHTGNLRSSIGYGVYEHGKLQIASAFNQVLDGGEGVELGNKYLEDLTDRYSQTFALVVIAAMPYAEYVEAIETKDVLASTDLWAKKVLGSYIQKAQQKAMKKINKLLNEF